MAERASSSALLFLAMLLLASSATTTTALDTTTTTTHPSFSLDSLALENLGDDASSAVDLRSKIFGDPKVSVAVKFISTLLTRTASRLAVGNYEKAARELFAPLALVLPPDLPLRYLPDPASQAAFLQEQRDLTGATFAVTRLDVYEPTPKRYLDYSIVTLGSMTTVRGPAKFVFLWDLVRDDGLTGAAAAAAADGYVATADELAAAAAGGVGGSNAAAAADNSLYIWAVSWMTWNYDLPAPKKSPPPPPPKSPPPHSPSPAAADGFHQALREVLLRGEFGAGASALLTRAKRLDAEAEMQQLPQCAKELLAAIRGDMGRGGPPKPPSPLRPDAGSALVGIQASIEAFFNALASGDLLGASRLFGPPGEPTLLLPPGSRALMLATTPQILQLLGDFVASGSTVAVTMEEVIVVKYKVSSYPIKGPNPYHVITRGSYTLLDNTATETDRGKMVQLWTQYLPPQPPPPSPQPAPAPAAAGITWYFSWALWSSDGPLLPPDFL
ncbi:hypothetical protein CLOM_g10575 [Closterium sp. NIES-68]|nr:hypothetical protein CLOM_g10575 [Closterium sp. NIES-68]GJP78833.1 hypothetical protein CLOP_g9101 [Closterium sp. NIES-67]